MTSPLTAPFAVMLANLNAQLENAGYSFDRSHVSQNQYLAAALSGLRGRSASELRMGFADLICGIANASDGGSRTAATAGVLVTCAACIDVLAGGGYTGPLDIVPGALLAVSQFALSAAKRGTPVYTVTRASDSTTQAFSTDATTGDPPTGIDAFTGADFLLMTAEIASAGAGGYDAGDGSPVTFDATLVGGTGAPATVNVTTDGGGSVVTVNSFTPGAYSVPPDGRADTTSDTGGTGLQFFVTFGRGLIATWNDQSSHGGDLTAASSTAAPGWQSNVTGTAPGLIARSARATSTVGGPPSMSLPNGGVTVFVVGSGNVNLDMESDVDGYLIVFTGVEGTAPAIDMSDGTNEAGGDYPLQAADSIHLFTAAWEFGSAKFQVDGVDVTQSDDWDSGGALGAFTTSGDASGITLNFGSIVSRLCEVIIYDHILTDPQIAAITANIMARYPELGT